MDIGRDYPHSTNIYPFRDNPDVPVRVTFWPVPITRDFVPFAHPFVLRNWDRLEEEDVPTYGTKYDPKEYYGGPLPTNPPGNPCGTADQWMGGIDYATYLAGGYTCDCPPMALATYVSSVRCDDGSLIVSPHTGDSELHLNVGHDNTWTALQTFDARADTSLSALQAFGNNGSADVLLMELHGNGLSFLGFQTAIGQNSNIANTRCTIFTPPAWVGLDIRAIGHGTPTRLLGVTAVSSVLAFAIQGNGDMWTGKTIATPFETLGNVVAKWPVYDASGTLIGYLPLFDSIT